MRLLRGVFSVLIVIWMHKKIGYTKRVAYFLFILSLSSYHLMTEWHKRQNHQFEVLQAEWNTDDGAAEKHSHCQVSQRHLNTTKDNPKYVE